MHACVHACMHAFIHTYIHTYIHVMYYIYVYIYIHLDTTTHMDPGRFQDTEMQVVIVGAGRADLVAQTKATSLKIEPGGISFLREKWMAYITYIHVYIYIYTYIYIYVCMYK